MFCLNYLINGREFTRRKLTKITTKSFLKKTRQSSKVDISDFKIEGAKMFCNEVLLAWCKFQGKIPSYS